MKIAPAAVALLLLAGCGRKEPEKPGTEPFQKAAADDHLLDCAPDGSAHLQRICTYEETEAQGGTTLILRKPDGGFRRVLITRDGRGVVAADGALPADVRVVGQNRVEVTIDGDRFVLPATVRPTR